MGEQVEEKPGVKLGYARVSSRDQNLQRQLDALKAAGCKRIFQEKKSGKNVDREGLRKLLDYAREGDTIVVTELWRFGRNLRDLIDLMAQLAERKIQFRSLKENIDTSTPTGRLIFHVIAVIGEFIREIQLELAAEGRAADIAKGGSGRRPYADRVKLEAARELCKAGMSQKAAAAIVGLGRATLGRHGIGITTTA